MIRYRASLLYRHGQRIAEPMVIEGVRVDWCRDRGMLQLFLVDEDARVALQLYDAQPVSWVGDGLYFTGWEVEAPGGPRCYQSLMLSAMSAAHEATQDGRSASPSATGPAAEALVKAMYLYPNYRVDSRGPCGLLLDALDEIAPGIAAELRQTGDWDAVHHRFWDPDDDEAGQPSARLLPCDYRAPDGGCCHPRTATLTCSVDGCFLATSQPVATPVGAKPEPYGKAIYWRGSVGDFVHDMRDDIPADKFREIAEAIAVDPGLDSSSVAPPPRACLSPANCRECPSKQTCPEQTLGAPDPPTAVGARDDEEDGTSSGLDLGPALTADGELVVTLYIDETERQHCLSREMWEAIAASAAPDPAELLETAHEWSRFLVQVPDLPQRYPDVWAALQNLDALLTEPAATDPAPEPERTCATCEHHRPGRTHCYRQWPQHSPGGTPCKKRDWELKLSLDSCGATGKAPEPDPTPEPTPEPSP